MVLANRRLAFWVMRDFTGRGIDLEDLEQIALEALVRAVQAFDPDRGVQFSTFAVTVVRNKIIHHLRRDPLKHRWAAAAGELPEIPVVDEQLAVVDLETDLQAFAATLSDRDRRVLSLTVAGRPQREIGRELGVSQYTISRWMTNIRRRCAA